MRFAPCLFASIVLFGISDVCVRAAELEKTHIVQTHDYRLWEKIIREELGPRLPGGFAYAIMDHGKVIASGAEGYARSPHEKTDPGVRWTLDKPMGLASVSKTITAVSMLHLWDEKEHSFSLDDPFWPLIRRVVPDCGEAGRKITIRQLLTHKSGLPHDDAIGDATTPAKIEKLLKEPLAHPPGEHYNYDNNNYYLLHLLIEEISHYSYTNYVKRHVFKPMGIEYMETHFEHDRTLCGYNDIADKRPGFPFDWDATPWAGAAGWYGSVDDLIHFMRGLRERTVLSEEATKILFSDLTGWDCAAPCYSKGGDWGWETPETAGSCHSAIMYGPDGVDAVLLINCKFQKHPAEALMDGWAQSRKKAEK